MKIQKEELLGWGTRMLPHAKLHKLLEHATTLFGTLSYISVCGSGSWCVQVLFEYLFQIPLGEYLALVLLGHMVILCLVFWGTSQLFSIEAGLLYSITAYVGEFQFLHILGSPCYTVSYYNIKRAEAKTFLEENMRKSLWTWNSKD